MPKDESLQKILLIGSGPIVIGQGCEFDYSGTQACKALREEGYDVVLVNSNPATIMTDPEFAERTYIEPITPPVIKKIIEKEKPDALLPTLGGQTALNAAMDLWHAGTLEELEVKMIGANADAIAKGEDRLLFKEAMRACRALDFRYMLFVERDGGSGKLIRWYEAMGFRVVPPDVLPGLDRAMVGYLPSDQTFYDVEGVGLDVEKYS